MSLAAAGLVAGYFTHNASAATVLAYWNFDSETAGVVPDASGNGQDARLRSTIPRPVPGRFNEFLPESGSGTTLTAPGGGRTSAASDRALNVKEDGWAVATTNFDLGVGDWSVSMWVRITSARQGRHFPLFDHQETPSRFEGYQANMSSQRGGELSLSPRFGSAVTGRGLALPAFQTWHHVALSVNRTQGTGRVYVNGAQTDAFSLTPLGQLPFSTNGRVLFFGAGNPFNQDDAGRAQTYGTGQIDDFAIFGDALNESQVKALHAGANVLNLIPEPSVTALSGLAAGLLLVRRRRR